jgi:hypothetical protein
MHALSTGAGSPPVGEQGASWKLTVFKRFILLTHNFFVQFNPLILQQ